MRTDFKSVIAIDCDDTIFYTKWPTIVGLKPNAKEIINRLYDENFCIILNTCRTGKDLETAIEFLNENGVKFHLANENHPSLCNYFQQDSRKISCDMFLDDKNLDCLIDKAKLDWNKMYKNIQIVTNNPSFKSVLQIFNK